MAACKIRPMRDSDTNFVLKSWLRTYRKSDETHTVSSPIYYEHMGPEVQEFIDRATILVAVDGTNVPETELLGFIAFEPMTDNLTALHYIYVKDVMRHFGFGSELFAAAGLKKDEPFIYTFHAPEARKLKKHATGGSHYPHHWFLDRFTK